MKRMICLLLAVFLLTGCSGAVDPGLEEFMQEHGLHLWEYPSSLLQLLERNPETLDFVCHYPLEKNRAEGFDPAEFDRSQGVPLFLQWDRRWGYMEYGADVAGLTACGPVCLSMAAYYLTGDLAFTPDNMIEFALENRYYSEGNGSKWTLISEGGKKLGFNVTELPLVEKRIMDCLEAGIPVICVVGPGDFTTTGHFLVMVGTEDGKIRINDPNSREKSNELWEFDRISGQIRNLWSIQVAD